MSTVPDLGILVCKTLLLKGENSVDICVVQPPHKATDSYRDLWVDWVHGRAIGIAVVAALMNVTTMFQNYSLTNKLGFCFWT